MMSLPHAIHKLQDSPYTCTWLHKCIIFYCKKNKLYLIYFSAFKPSTPRDEHSGARTIESRPKSQTRPSQTPKSKATSSPIFNEKPKKNKSDAKVRITDYYCFELNKIHSFQLYWSKTRAELLLSPCVCHSVHRLSHSIFP